MSQGLVLNSVKERLLFLSPTVQGRLEREACSSDFEVIQGLGQGAFGKVYKVRHKKTKHVYALKQISKKQIKSQKMIQQIINEVKIMYNLDHQNIVKLYNHYEEEDYMYLVLECATGGQLWQKLNKVTRFDEKTVKQFMIEIMSAIEYLHTRNPPIIHRDIKPENILLDSNGRIKIADFGWSNINNHQRTTYCGTLDYLAPEMIMESGHDEKIDYWSLGVLIFELLTGKAPFAVQSSIKDQKEQQRQLEDNILKVKIVFPPDFPTLAKSLVLGLLNKDPVKRFGIQQMKDHPWLSDCDQSKTNNVEPQKILVDNIKEVVKDEKAQFSKEEIASVANRKVNEPEEEQVIIVEEHEQQQDLSKNTVQILNGKIQDLTKQLNETKVLLQVKLEENKQLQLQIQDKNQNSTQSTVDARRIKLLEDEKVKMKRDYEIIWDELRQKEAQILKLNSELGRVAEYQKQVDKLKGDKQQLQDKIRKMIDEIDQRDQQLMEVKNDQDQLNSSRMVRQQSNHGSFLNQSGLDESMSLMDLSTTFSEMKHKFEIAKEQIEEFDKAQRKIIQQQSEIISLKTQLNSFKELIRSEINDQFEEQIEDIQKQHREVMRENESKQYREMQIYEQEKLALKDQVRELENKRIEVEGMKKEMTQVNQIINDMKIQIDMNKKLRSQYEQRLREQELMILDYKEKERSYRKK